MRAFSCMQALTPSERAPLNTQTDSTASTTGSSVGEAVLNDCQITTCTMCSTSNQPVSELRRDRHPSVGDACDPPPQRWSALLPRGRGHHREETKQETQCLATAHSWVWSSVRSSAWRQTAGSRRLACMTHTPYWVQAATATCTALSPLRESTGCSQEAHPIIAAEPECS